MEGGVEGVRDENGLWKGEGAAQHEEEEESEVYVRVFRQFTKMPFYLYLFTFPF